MDACGPLRPCAFRIEEYDSLLVVEEEQNAQIAILIQRCEA